MAESKESTLQLDALAWFELNKRRVLAVLGLLIFVVLAVMVWRWNAARAEADASHALLRAYLSSQGSAGESGPAGSAVGSDVLLKLAGTHSGTRASTRAMLLAAGQLFAEGKYADARTRYEAYAQQDPNGTFVPAAMYGVAVCLDAMDKTAEALEAYQKVATQYASDPVAARARMARARLLEAQGKASDALALYEEVSKGGTMGAMSQQAAMRREQLLQKHPELVKPAVVTNAAEAATLTNAIKVIAPPAPGAPSKKP